MKIKSLNIKVSEVEDQEYLRDLYWSPDMIIPDIYHTGIEINNSMFIPSLVDGVLYIDNITASFNIDTEKETGDKNPIRTIKLKVKSYDDIDILLDTTIIEVPISTYADKNLERQRIELINSKTPLFKINNLDVNKTYNIIFHIVINGYIGVEEIFYKFIYNIDNNLGDVNGDGVIDIMDLVNLSNYLTNDKSIKYPNFGDINKRGNIGIYELVSLSNYILNNG